MPSMANEKIVGTTVQETPELIEISDSESESAGHSPIGPYWPPRTQYERFAAYSKIVKRKNSVATLLWVKIVPKQKLFRELLKEFPNLRDEIEEWYKQIQHSFHTDTDDEFTTKHERFALYAQIAKEEHIIPIIRGQVIREQGIFANLLRYFPFLHDELEEWYRQNKSNKKFELCKSRYHGIINAKTTKFTSIKWASRQDYREVNVWMVENLCDSWQRIMENMENGHDPLLLAAQKSLPYETSKRKPWIMEVALSGCKPIDEEATQAAFRCPEPRTPTLLTGMGESTMPLVLSVEKDVDQPYDSYMSSSKRIQGRQCLMQPQKRPQAPGQMSNEIQTFIHNSFNYPMKRTRSNSSAPVLVRHSQEIDDTRFGSPIPADDYMNGMSTQTPQTPGAVAGGSDENIQYHTANQPSTYNQALNSERSEALTYNNSGFRQSSAETSAQSGVGMQVAQMQVGGQAKKISHEILGRPKDIKPQAEGFRMPTANHMNSESGEIIRQDAATWDSDGPVKSQIEDSMAESAVEEAYQADCQMEFKSVSEQTSRKSNAYYQSPIPKNEIAEMAPPNNSINGMHAIPQRRSQRHGMSSPNMDSVFRQKSQFFTQPVGQYQRPAQKSRMQRSDASSPYAHSSPQDKASIPRSSVAMKGPARTANRPRMEPLYEGRTAAGTVIHLEESLRSAVLTFFLDEQETEYLGGFYEKLLEAVFSRDKKRIDAAEEARALALHGLRLFHPDAAPPLQSNSFVQYSVYAEGAQPLQSPSGIPASSQMVNQPGTAVLLLHFDKSNIMPIS